MGRKPAVKSRSNVCICCGVRLPELAVTVIVLIPGGIEPRHYEAQISRNLEMIIGSGIFYAPTLAFGLPIALAILGYTMSDRFERASAWFAGLIAVILFVTTNFEEVRAEQMLFPLLAPAALLGLRRILGEPSALDIPHVHQS